MRVQYVVHAVKPRHILLCCLTFGCVNVDEENPHDILSRAEVTERAGSCEMIIRVAVY